MDGLQTDYENNNKIPRSTKKQMAKRKRTKKDQKVQKSTVKFRKYQKCTETKRTKM